MALTSYIPKLVLQPLEENAIAPGIGMRETRPGASTLRSALRQGIRIFVTDDGVGIEKDRLSEMNRRLAACEGALWHTDAHRATGSSNVNDRFKLSSGPEYGVLYESVAGSYTRAIITCPLCSAKGEALA